MPTYLSWELRKILKLHSLQCTICQLVLKPERATQKFTRDASVFLHPHLEKHRIIHVCLFFFLTVYQKKLKRHKAQRSCDKGRQKCPKNKMAKGKSAQNGKNISIKEAYIIPNLEEITIHYTFWGQLLCQYCRAGKINWKCYIPGTEPHGLKSSSSVSFITTLWGWYFSSLILQVRNLIQ